eukprot:TRINITY_DN5798_c0_g1_i1.p1 TRINITY_DN5798_c0_g1~~TRINITY_DN5798_c0_g1_i1.p1  ORF type:complete len:120 (+),score=5.92 TRINITY_DN5798_c0_g1_i1:157-516(+)
MRHQKFYDFQMPDFYQDSVCVSVRSVMVLDQSIKNIVHAGAGVKSYKNTRLPFTDFYSAFFVKLRKLETENRVCYKSHDGEGEACRCSVCDYFDNDIEIMSRFLIRLIKLVVDSPNIHF